MVASGYRCITEGLGVSHLRLVIGSSMGGMHAWMWAELYPDLMDGVVALSCQPVEISGRNWLARRAAAEAIRHDPDWKNGLRAEPAPLLYSAAGTFTTESPTRIQEMAPTLAAANALYERRLAEAAQGDANNQLWAIEAIQDYNPEPGPRQDHGQGAADQRRRGPRQPARARHRRAGDAARQARPLCAAPGRPRHARPFQPLLRQAMKSSLIEFMATLGPEQTGSAAAAS